VSRGNGLLQVTVMICLGYAKMSPEKMKKVKALESELGVTLLAFEKPTYSVLEEEDLAKIQDMEKELGLALVAYEV
jgi:aryl-alcohol dehydrogenase-like predicted oxidoreductase